MAISVENRKILLLLVFCAPLKGVVRGIGYRRWGSKTRMMGLPCRSRKKFDDIFSRVDRMPDRMWRTDRRTTAKTALT